MVIVGVIVGVGVIVLVGVGVLVGVVDCVGGGVESALGGVAWGDSCGAVDGVSESAFSEVCLAGKMGSADSRWGARTWRIAPVQAELCDW